MWCVLRQYVCVVRKTSRRNHMWVWSLIVGLRGRSKKAGDVQGCSQPRYVFLCHPSFKNHDSPEHLGTHPHGWPEPKSKLHLHLQCHDVLTLVILYKPPRSACTQSDNYRRNCPELPPESGSPLQGGSWGRNRIGQREGPKMWKKYTGT